MELNKFEKSFKVAIEELSNINGRIFVLNSFLNQTKARIEKDDKVGHELITSALPLRDITLDKETSNLFLPSDHYKLNRNNLREEVDMILSRECLFQISQAYEILETYLYDQVAELIRLNNDLNLFIDQKTNKSTFISIRKALKGFNERVNNKHLLGIIRANCKLFFDYEKSNIYDLNFQEWYEMLSLVRHCITHNRTYILNNTFPSCYSIYFKTVTYNGAQVVFINFDKCVELLSRIADYTFFIFKSVSEKSYGSNIDFESIQHFMPDIYATLIKKKSF